jgi:hypothetical protein
VKGLVNTDISLSGLYGSLNVDLNDGKMVEQVLTAADPYVDWTMVGRTLRVRGTNDEQIVASVDEQSLVGGITLGANASSTADVVVLRTTTTKSTVNSDGTISTPTASYVTFWPETDSEMVEATALGATTDGRCITVERVVEWQNAPADVTAADLKARARYEWTRLGAGARIAAIPGATLTPLAAIDIAELAPGQLIRVDIDNGCRRATGVHQVVAVGAEFGTRVSPVSASNTSSGGQRPTAERAWISTVPWTSRRGARI